YGFVNISRSGGDFPMNFITIGPLLFYVSVAYAIVRHDLFDIDALLKQAAIYVTLTLAITATYAVSLIVLGLLLPPSAVRSSPVFNVAFVVLVAIFFEPLRDRVQRFVNRTFYRDRPDFRRTVSEVSAALTSLLDLNEILARVGRTVTKGIQARSFAVILWSDEKTEVWRYDAGAHRMIEGSTLPLAPLRTLLERDARARWHERRDGDDGARPAWDAVAPLRPDAIIPLTRGTRVTGAFVVGSQRS